MYDGPDQIKKFKQIIKKSNVPEDFVILRDRWYDKNNNFGIKLTNRTGTIKIGNEAGTTSTVTIGRSGNGKQTVLDSGQTLVNGELFFPTSTINLQCNASASALNFFGNFDGGMNFMNGLNTGYMNIANSFVLYRSYLRFNNVASTFLVPFPP
jgi:hypothetical protein